MFQSAVFFSPIDFDDDVRIGPFEDFDLAGHGDPDGRVEQSEGVMRQGARRQAQRQTEDRQTPRSNPANRPVADH